MLERRRNRRNIKLAVTTTVAVAAVMLLPGIGFAQSSTLDITEVLRLVLERNTAVQIAEASADQAESLHRQTLADTRPQIDLQLDPVYGYSKGVLTGQTTPPFEPQHELSLGLSLSQALPTSGIASLSLANSMTRIPNKGSFVQSPSATFVLTQPVWVNRRLFDLRQLSAARRASEINWRKATIGTLEARNGSLFAAFSLYTQVVGLRRNIAYLEKSLELADRNLRQVRINLDTGRASETDLLELEILIGLQREALLENQYALLQVEQSMANTLGLVADLGSYRLLEAFPALQLPADALVLVEEAKSENPTVLQNRLALEQIQAQSILSGQSDTANLSLALTLLPQYAGATPTDFGESFASFFTEGTELDWSVSVGLEVPLYNGGKKALRERINAAGERIARESVDAGLRDVRNTYEALILRQRIILDRIELLDKNIVLKRRAAEDEQKKLEVGLGTDLRVESARLELMQVENEMWRARADLFLNSLDLFNLSGRSLIEILAGL